MTDNIEAVNLLVEQYTTSNSPELRTQLAHQVVERVKMLLAQGLIRAEEDIIWREYEHDGEVDHWCASPKCTSPEGRQFKRVGQPVIWVKNRHTDVTTYYHPRCWEVVQNARA